MLSTRIRIELIGYIAAVSSVLLGIIQYGTLSDSQSKRVALDRLSAVELRAAQLDVELLEARRYEKDFIIRRTEEPLQQHATAMTNAADLRPGSPPV